MKDQTLPVELRKKLEQLARKYETSGQKLSDYLDGMMRTQYLTYWDYIQLETLLSLQRPKTDLKDEMIFVTYHQITELYFKLILWELEQLSDGEITEPKTVLDKINRLNRYFGQLENSFTVMTEGMEHQQFAEFRMALMPSSGFQSVQYRLIEIYATDVVNLLHPDHVLWLSEDSSPKEYLNGLYWKTGSRDSKTGQKTLTLRQFEEEYDALLLEKIEALRLSNLWQRIRPFVQPTSELSEEIRQAARTFDQLANVFWPLAHFRAAVRYLINGKDAKPATGGTNWRKYLPPRYQRVIFFPELWTDIEKEDWGKSWVLENISENSYRESPFPEQ